MQDARDRVEGEREFLSPNQIKVIKEHLDYVFNKKPTVTYKDNLDALKHEAARSIASGRITGPEQSIC